MTPRQLVPLRKLGFWCLGAVYCFLTVYLGLISLVSIWIGLEHMDQAGYWVPILAGGALLMVLCVVSYRMIRHMMSQVKEDFVGL